MRFLLQLGFLQGGQLGFGQHGALLRHLGFQRLETLFHVLQVVALPDAAHAEGGDGQAAPAQFIGYPRLAPCRLLGGQVHHRGLDRGFDPVLQQRLAPADVHQGQLAAGFVEVLEAIEAIA